MDTQSAIQARQARQLKEAREEMEASRHEMEALKAQIRDMPTPLDAYPVGSIYITAADTPPDQLFGGTWQAYAQGRVLAGFHSGDADFNQIGKTGGSKTVTLSAAQIPKHSHPIKWYQGQYVSLSGSGQGASSSGYRTGYTSGTVYHNATMADEQDSGGGAHQNMPPYITVKIWMRTA